jgi:hypothetical protein
LNYFGFRVKNCHELFKYKLIGLAVLNSQGYSCCIIYPFKVVA